jgi:hypothetical protein
VINNVEATH